MCGDHTGREERRDVKINKKRSWHCLNPYKDSCLITNRWLCKLRISVQLCFNNKLHYKLNPASHVGFSVHCMSMQCSDNPVHQSQTTSWTVVSCMYIYVSAIQKLLYQHVIYTCQLCSIVIIQFVSTFTVLCHYMFTSIHSIS